VQNDIVSKGKEQV